MPASANWPSVKSDSGVIVVMMGVAPGEIRKVHREQLNAVIYGALEK